MFLGKKSRKNPADPTVSAYNVMVFELVNLFVQFSPPKNKPDSSFYQELHDGPDRVEEKPDSQYNENNRKDPARLTAFMHFTVPYGGEGDDRHVQRIYQPPTLNHHISGSAEDK
jgi:hypothetical protein